MKVTDLMSTDLAVLPRTAKVAEAGDLILGRMISSVLVDRECSDEPWGIVTRSDIVSKVAARNLDPHRTTVAELMTLALMTIDPELGVGYASRMMHRFGIHHLPVVRGEELLGILSYHDVLRVLHLLRTIPFFERLPVPDLTALLTVASIENHKEGDILIREGETGRNLFILEEGEMIVSTRRAGRIARIRAGELFGEMELFGGVRSATIRAKRDSRVLVLAGDRFERLATERKAIGAVVFESMSRLLSERLRHANRYLFLRGIWTHRALVLRIFGVISLAFVLLVLGTATISETPSFCRTCHNMLPYHESWTKSPHRDVKCTKCHWSYGLRGAIRGKITGVAMVVRYVTGTYGPKPEAEVDDESCLRSECHKPELPAWKFTNSDSQNLRFDHALHLNSLRPIGRLRCTSCHSHRGQEEHFSVSASTCFLCHFPGMGTRPTPCLGCHDFASLEGAPQPQLRVNHAAFKNGTDCLACHRNVVSGEGRVEEDRCRSCHSRIDTLSVGRMHKVHVRSEDVDCFECHSTLAHPGPSDRILAGRCDACHGDPHKAQERLYLGEGGIDVADRPALMFFYHVECTACHRIEEAGTDSISIPDHEDREKVPCLECHDVTFPDRVRMWSKQIDRRLAELKGLLAIVAVRMGEEGQDRTPRAYRLYMEALQNYDVVAADPSAGIHNYRYAEDLLNACKEKLAAAMESLDTRQGGKP